MPGVGSLSRLPGDLTRSFGQRLLPHGPSRQDERCPSQRTRRGLRLDAEDLLPQVEKITPRLGISMQQISILDIINRFEELSAMLGADLEAPEVVEAREAFTAAEADLKAAIAETPGLIVLVTSPAADNIYIASSEWVPDFVYFRELGLDVVAHGTDDFFELISW